MKNTFYFMLVMGFTFSMALSCNTGSSPGKKDNTKELPKIEKAINDCIGWAKTKDFDLLFSVVANDPNYMSVHPTDNVVKGFKQFNDNCNFLRSEHFKAVSHEVRELKITLSKSGDVAWFY